MLKEIIKRTHLAKQMLVSIKQIIFQKKFIKTVKKIKKNKDA